MEPTAMTPGDYIAILKRRKWGLILPAFFVIIVAALVAFLLPPVYKSSATILIESQDIPESFVMSTVTSFAEQRIQSINQRIMSFTRLMQVIKRFGLYPDMREKETDEEVVDKMREDTTLKPISAEIVDPRTGRPAMAVIAFSLSYEGENPQKVQQVTNTLTSQLLEENIRTRVRQVEDASAFLESEIQKIKRELTDHDARLAAFKQANIDELPEMMQANLQNLNMLERDLEVAGERLRSLKEREEYLQTQLAGVKPYMASEENIGRQRLEQLKVELAMLRQQFTDEYPDVKRIKAEIAELEAKKASADPSEGSEKDPADNPAYITLSAQVAGVRTELLSVQRRIGELKKSAADYRGHIAATPKVEDRYNDLLIERNLAQAKYDDLVRKLMEARVAQGLEKEQKGERFSLIEPPVLPEKPHKPNRLAILLIGCVLGLGTGVGFAAIREFTDDRLYRADALADATGFPVLAGIPEIATDADIRRRRLKRLAAAAGGLGATLAGVWAFHTFVMDWNIFWVKLVRKLGL